MQSWKIIQNEFSIEDNLKNESIFTTANGYLGMRGDMEEGIHQNLSYATLPGNYINGFYELEDIEYHEGGHGYAEHDQTMLNLCNPRKWRLIVDGEEFHPSQDSIKSFYREMDMQKGVLTRKMTWQTGHGKDVEITVRRLACFLRPSTAAVSYTVRPLNFSGTIEIALLTDISQVRKLDENDPRIDRRHFDALTIETFQLDKDITYLSQHTDRSGFIVGMAAADRIEGGILFERLPYPESSTRGFIYRFDGKQGHDITLERFMSFATSQTVKGNLEEICRDECLKARDSGFLALLKEQEEYLKDFWNYCDIEIDGPEDIQQAIRFNLFQLLQSTGRDSVTSVAAKGLTGDGYKGHYFWESEAYIMPVFMCSKPEIARSMLIYRYSILDQARKQARLLGHPNGALYSWRSINGDECSAYYPAGSAQYHINADIAFGIKRYVEATEDTDFLLDYGAEVIFETARLWANVGHFNSRKEGRFCINTVTGPDEYTALVDNNCYTNIMARENVAFAVKIYKFLKSSHPQRLQALAAKIGLAEEEIVLFDEIANKMYIPFDDELKIHKQDDTFLDKKVLDLSKIPPENLPLLIHYHPLFIYRHQVCKQPDLVLAQFMVGHLFSLDQKRRDYDYYEKVTIHDSSLSASIFSIMASEIGYHDKAYSYFIETARMDLDDTHNNTRFGLHMANMAGTWAAVVNGFGGMRIQEDILRFKPYLPGNWKAYTFKVRYSGNVLSIQVDQEGVTYSLLEGEKAKFIHMDQETELLKGCVKRYKF